MFIYTCVNIKYVAESIISDLMVLDVFFSYLIPLDALHSSDCCMIKTNDFFEIVLR